MNILLFILLLSFSVQLFFYLFIFSRLAFYTPKTKENKYENKTQTDYPPISIIICAKNEEKNLKQNLPFILEQDYPHFEVLIINDVSTDGTQILLNRLKTKHNHLNTVQLKDKVSERALQGKKHALTQGILSSQHDILLLTDADCRPASNKWLKLMCNDLIDKDKSDVSIVLGYGPYHQHQGWLQRFIQFETIYTALQYLSFALAGWPYMGVGRNLAYRKALFFQTNGFGKHQRVASGDDDLFVKEVATQKNTRIVIDKNAFCYSEPCRTWQAWYRQKSRHLSTGKHYNWQHQCLLGALSLSHFLFYGTLIAVLLCTNCWIIAGIVVTLRLVIQLIIYRYVLEKLRALHLWLWIPFLDALYVFYYLVFSPSLLLNRPTSWRN